MGVSVGVGAASDPLVVHGVCGGVRGAGVGVGVVCGYGCGCGCGVWVWVWVGVGLKTAKKKKSRKEPWPGEKANTNKIAKPTLTSGLM